MKVKISRAELQSALEKVKPGLASQEVIEQSTSFAFVDGRVVTYNDEISISHPVENLNGTGAIKAQSLYAFLNKVTTDEISIQWENEQIRITAGRAKAGLVLEQEVRLPVEEIGKIGKWRRIPKTLLDALKFCYPCCSKDMSRPVLTCVHVDGMTVEASDSFQIVRHQLDKKMPGKGFLIPATAVHELVKYDVTRIARGDGWLHFKTKDGTVFSSRVFDGEFPNVDKFFDLKGVEIPFPEDAPNILEKARVFSKNDFYSHNLEEIEIQIKDGRIRFSTKNESGWFEETMKTKYTGEPISFVTGVQFLISLFKRTPVCEFGEERIRFSGDGWNHIVAVISKD